jgi:hypothetical protein
MKTRPNLEGGRPLTDNIRSSAVTEALPLGEIQPPVPAELAQPAAPVPALPQGQTESA